jgi:hypothetical protein
MAVFSVTSIFSELGNGACFALVPHLPHNVGLLVVQLDDHTDNILGFHVRPCRVVWKSGRYHFCPRFQDADGCGKGLLDNWHYMYGGECFADCY